MQTTDAVCILCKQQLINSISAPERMFGLGGLFEFGACPICGMLSQLNPPVDLSAYYPSKNYYSLHAATVKRWHSFPPKEWIANKRNEAQLFGKPQWARWLATKHPSPGVVDVLKLLSNLRLSKGYKLQILDIGCGGGEMLCHFASVGFQCLEGVDPFIAQPELRIGNVRIRKISHIDLKNEQYDLILLSHSLEHMPDQIAAMAKLKDLLSVEGIARIEVPVADCDAFVYYGKDWIELDPPRHLHLHTRESLRLLAHRCALNVVQIEEVGTTFEFWGSELYRRGMTLYESDFKMRTVEESFSLEEQEVFKTKSVIANKSGRGGRVAIYLSR